jgi:CIC family chloride channel protein
VGDICARHVLVAFPEESIGQALQRMGARDIGRLPVVRRGRPRELVGWLRRSDVLRAYDVALTRRAALRHRIHQVRLDAVSGGDVQVFEILIEAGAACDGKKVKEIEWPPNCLLASVRKGRRVEVPHGHTELRAGNTLVVVVDGGEADAVARLCSNNGSKRL